MLLLWTILLWWRPAISHYSILLIFRHSLPLRLSDHQVSLCQSWTCSQILVVEQQRKLRVHLTKNLLRPLRKRKSNRPLNPKLFLVLQKDGEEGFAGIQLRLTLHQIWTLTYLFLSLTILRKKRNNTLIVCTVLVVSLKTAMEKSG